jgi:hypothetical protein
VCREVSSPPSPPCYGDKYLSPGITSALSQLPPHSNRKLPETSESPIEMNSTELDSGSRSVLGIMAFIYPASIPQELFETETTAGSLASLSISFDHSQ